MDSGNTTDSAESSPRIKAEDQDVRYPGSNQGFCDLATPRIPQETEESGGNIDNNTLLKNDSDRGFGTDTLTSFPGDWQHQSNSNASMHIVHSNGEGDNDDIDDHTSKKPRLRLAHACDRCRRRKIRVRLD
jgi:hypothetical protein